MRTYQEEYPGPGLAQVPHRRNRIQPFTNESGQHRQGTRILSCGCCGERGHKVNSCPWIRDRGERTKNAKDAFADISVEESQEFESGGFVALEVIPTKCFSIVMMIREAVENLVSSRHRDTQPPFGVLCKMYNRSMQQVGPTTIISSDILDTWATIGRKHHLVVASRHLLDITYQCSVRSCKKWRDTTWIVWDEHVAFGAETTCAHPSGRSCSDACASCSQDQCTCQARSKNVPHYIPIVRLPGELQQDLRPQQGEDGPDGCEGVAVHTSIHKYACLSTAEESAEGGQHDAGATYDDALVYTCLCVRHLCPIIYICKILRTRT